MDAGKKQQPDAGGIDMDMRLICEDLAEQKLIPGAFCQDYEMFKVIFRFVERRLKRSKSSSCLILLTLMDRQGDVPLLAERERQMEELGAVVQGSLRLGDVFTQYSSCQYLLMVPDAAENEANRIAQRIHDSFFLRHPESSTRLLLHHCYPMFSAGEKEKNEAESAETD